ncbi:hypothetical protein OURE66S_04423 [Oligella ureolytica]
MLNSMKMMGQAWQNFATMAPQASTMAMDPNELDKRIEELKAVESWLKLNLSMLSSSIHSLEIQKANLQNFNSLMEMMQLNQSKPLKHHQKLQQNSQKAKQRPKLLLKKLVLPKAKVLPKTTEAADNNDEQTSFAETSSLVQEQALNWFNLLGDQFKNIVSSVASATPVEEPTETATSPTEDVKATAKKATKKVAKKATKSAAKKTPVVKKAATKKSNPGTASKKTTATKKAIVKKADN